MNCLECKIEFSGRKRKYCTRLCCTRAINKRHKDTINANARERTKNLTDEERAKKTELHRIYVREHKEEVIGTNRKRNNTGELANPDDVIFYGYKEPLTKFGGGYGYMGVLSYSKSNDKVQCHLCGRLFKSLNNGHLGKVHSLTSRQYKDKVGLKPSTSLVGEGTRKKLIDRGWNPQHMEELRKVQERRREIIRQTGIDPNTHPKMSLEKKNERGTCPDQLLDKIDNTIKSFGRVPTEEEFLKFHNGKFLGSIRKTYGTWTTALSYLNQRPNVRRYTREELLESMRNFYRVNNRTPRWSDMERGLLPSSSVFYRNFKSINEARREAGVPVLIPVGKHYEETLIPN